MKEVARFGGVVACFFGYSAVEDFSAWPTAVPRPKLLNKSSNFNKQDSRTGKSTQTSDGTALPLLTDAFLSVDVVLTNIISRSRSRIKDSLNNIRCSHNISSSKCTNRNKWFIISLCLNSKWRTKNQRRKSYLDFSIFEFLDMLFFTFKLNFYNY